MERTMQSTVACNEIRGSARYVELAIFTGALLLYGLLPSHNYHYADDSLRWAYAITQPSGLINSHHLYLNIMREIYHALHAVFGTAVEPARLLALYSALWGAVGLVWFYRLLRILGCGAVALPGTLACAFTTNYWAYSIVGDVYVPATALMVIGAYAFIRSLRANSYRSQVGGTLAAIVAFVLMILHHQAYSVFVIGLTAGTLFTRESIWKRRLIQSVIVLAVTGIVALAIYGVVYRATQDTETTSLRAFVSGYVDSLNARPDQKRISLSILANSAAGQLRALLPYYVMFRSASVTHAIQQRFPYRYVYPYPYLVRSLSPIDIALILVGAIVVGVAGCVLCVCGAITLLREKDGALAILFAMFPQALFFIWWEGISDEFWIWSLPLVIMVAAKGAARGQRWGQRWPVRLLNAAVVGLFVCSLLGAILLFANPDNDIDAVNRRYLARVSAADMVVGFDEIQATGRTHLAMEQQGFLYFNVFDHSFNWSGADLAELEREIAETLARGGKIFVDSYILHPPKSHLAFIRLTNPEFDVQRQNILVHLRSVPSARIEWISQDATVPGYFVD